MQIADLGAIDVVDKGLALLKVIHKIPMFAGLGPELTRAVLQSCEFRGVASGELICKVNEASSELFILLSGQLGVYDQQQVLLASIDPVAPVGEMGLITGQPRSATVSALRECKLLVLRKVSFDRLMRANTDICRRVYASVIGALYDRLRQTRQEYQLGDRRHSVLEEKLRQVEREIDVLQNGLVHAEA